MSMIKAIIFDCFGVIISDALSVLCSDLSRRDPATYDQIRALIRASNRGLLDSEESNKQVASLLGLDFAEYQEKIRSGEVKDQQLLDFAASLRSQYKTAMLSNISSSGLKKRFTDDELQKYFDVVVASGDIGYAKPDPVAYEMTSERLGVRADECIFTDDIPDYCDAARSVGMQAICYENFAQLKSEIAPLLQQE